MTMITSGCGCAAGACACSGSCCDGNDVLVPAAIANPPGQAALRHRIGTHASFFESMLAHLVAPPEQAARCEGEAPDADDPITSWPLRELTSRELDDPTIALLDAWAVVGDILTFYQERIANEGYLRTATEQRSVEELARLVGYAPRPGVAASIDLAFSLERDVVTTIPAGTRAQSLPAPGKLPQTFETSRPLLANARWNAMRPLQSRFIKPRVIGERLIVYLEGTASSLRINDVVFIPPSADKTPTPAELGASALYRVDSIEILADIAKTRVHLRRYKNALANNATMVPEYEGKLDEEVGNILSSVTDTSSDARFWTDREILDLVGEDLVTRESLRRAIEEGGSLRRSKTVLHVFRASSPLFGHNAAEKRFLGVNVNSVPIELSWPFPSEQPNVLFLDVANERVLPEGFIVVDQATKVVAPPVSGPFKLGTTLSTLAQHFALTEGTVDTLKDIASDSPSAVARFWLQTLKDNAEQIKLPITDRMGAIVKHAIVELLNALEELPPSVEDQRDAFEADVEEILAGEDEDVHPIADALADLDQAASDAALPTEIEDTLAVFKIESVRTYSRDAYGITKQTVEVTVPLQYPWFDWNTNPNPKDAFLAPLRSVVTHHESEQLRVARTPLDKLDGNAGASGQVVIELEGLVFDLEPGRTLIVEGEDADAPGAIRTERVRITSVNHDFVDVATLVTLAAPLEYTYLRAKTIIYGNVAGATQGESRREVLGSGDASKPSQRFVLRHQPLTHVPAATASGAASTLTVRVQGFAWPEVEHRVGLGPRPRNVVTQRDEQGRTLVSGGDGWQGARFPTGIENIVAEYRSGQGADGNIEPHKATTLATRPFGVQKVTNPLAASGGADPDDIESTRLRAPLAVEALDRLLSVDDYRSFALNFAGIAKAVATRVGSGDVFGRWRIRTVVAGLVAEPLDPASELMLRLARAMRLLGDPALELELVAAKLQRLSITAKLAIAPGYAFVDVEPLVRAHLLDALGYARQDIGQGIPPSRIAALIQAVPGVAFVDLDELGTSDTVYDLDPLVFDPDPGKHVEATEDPPPKTDATDTMIVVADDTILYLDPTQTDTLALEELTP